ncbi:MAG: tyrosine-type recombinase/integrase [Elusimicrobia bacterium]|nr:tyrosine-type recombinase/integrase [Elusimicrobiota bacterium]
MGIAIQSIKPQDLTWDRALRLFSLRCRSQNLTPATQKLYAVNLNCWQRWTASQGASPCDVTADLLRGYLQFMRERGRKDSTIDCVFRILRAFWRFLERDGLILVNPMSRVERPKREKRLIKAFTEEQVRLLLGAIQTRTPFGLRDFTICVLLADTGLRASEAMGLRLPDLDFGQGVLTVLGKGRKERVVPFGQTASRALMDWLRVRGDLQGVDALWCNRFGLKMAKRTFEDRLRGYGVAAGLQDVRCSMHTFRHFFAVQYLRNGGDVLTLQKILGHSTLEMTRIYAQVADTDAVTRHRQASPLDRMGAPPGERRRVRLK